MTGNNTQMAGGTDGRYPSISDLRVKARKRTPHFAFEYLDSGTGREQAMQRNEDDLARVVLKPRFLGGLFDPDVGTELFGVQYNAPFGVAPVGMSSLMWPGAEQILARCRFRGGR